MKRIIGVLVLFCLIWSVGMAAGYPETAHPCHSGTYSYSYTHPTAADYLAITFDERSFEYTPFSLYYFSITDSSGNECTFPPNNGDVQWIGNTVYIPGNTFSLVYDLQIEITEYPIGNEDDDVQFDYVESEEKYGFKITNIKGLSTNEYDLEIHLDCDENGIITHYSGNATEVIIPSALRGNVVTGIGGYAFSSRNDLKSIIMPNSVTSIGEHAFDGCTGLTSITMSNSLTSIGEYAFNGCNGLTSITIPDGVTSIGDYAFYAFYGLTSISLPNSVTSIGDYAFAFCVELTSITLPNSVTSIGDFAFCECPVLTSITLPDQITSIGESPFESSATLYVPSIGGNAAHALSNAGYPFSIATEPEFSLIFNNSYLILSKYYGSSSTVTIPNYVTGIGDYAFNNYSEITSIVLPDGIISIGENPFLTNIALYVSSIGSNTAHTLSNAGYSFRVATDTDFGLKYEQSGLTLVKYYGSSPTVAVPNYVTSIGNSVFSDCSGLLSIEIPSSVTSIGNCAFLGCSGLTNITLPDGITTIGSNAFYNDTAIYVPRMDCRTAYSLSNAGCPFGISSYADFTFMYKDSALTLIKYYGSSPTVEIPSGVTGIGDNAFYDCLNLLSIEIPSGVATIGNNAFSGCSNLFSIEIPSSVTSIGDSAFRGCSGLTSITLPNSMTSIGDSAFYECSNLLSIEIPSGVTSIANYTFSGCSDLVKVEIPNGVTSIGWGAFYQCSSLTNIFLPDSVTYIDTFAFYNCTNLQSINIPKGVTTIGGSAFYHCDSLSAVEISNGVKTIGGFQYCGSLTAINIPESVTTIGAFSGCYNLSKVAIYGNTTKIGDNAFDRYNLQIYCYEFSDADFWADENNIQKVYLDSVSDVQFISLPEDFKIASNSKRAIVPNVFPCGSNDAINWSSSNSKVASVANGIVTALKPGKVTITASVGNLSDSVEVTVYKPVDITLNTDYYVESKKEIDIMPAGVDVTLVWECQDTSIATVNADGVVYGKKPGTTMITATDVDTGIKKATTMHVTYPVTTISFGKSDMEALIGYSVALEASVTTRDATVVNQLISFSSSNDAIATVDANGVVDPLTVGDADITATNGSTSAVITIHVTKGLTLPSSLKTIESGAFVDVKGSYIRIPASVTSIANDAFDSDDVLIVKRGSKAADWAKNSNMKYIEE